MISSPSPAVVEAIAKTHAVPVRRIGTVRRRAEGLRILAGDRLMEADIDRLSVAWHDAIPVIMSAPVSSAVLEPVMVEV